MSHVLHLGHQPTDIAGITGRMSTDAAGFDPTLDVNAIRHIGFNSHAAPFSFGISEPAGDLWIGVRYVAPNGDANIINRADSNFLEVFDASNLLLAQTKPLTSTSRHRPWRHLRAGQLLPASVSAIAGLHLKQIAQAGTEGPNAAAGFLSMGGINHDAPGVAVPTVAPRPVYSS
jgi:hypothetical protein